LAEELLAALLVNNFNELHKEPSEDTVLKAPIKASGSRNTTSNWQGEVKAPL
jgi:hypothetical protein